MHMNLNHIIIHIILYAPKFKFNLMYMHWGAIVSFQITGDPVGEVRAVSGMHQRKAEMARQADAFIALPGN